MRLFGNMYGGEIVFLLIWVLGSIGFGGAIAASVLGLGWGLRSEERRVGKECRSRSCT